MRRSKIRAYIHFVWGTYQRFRLITPEIEEALYRCIQGEVRQVGADVLAIGGMPDHVHLVVAFPATLSFGDFMRRIKSVSSKCASETLLPADSFFKWQDGYGLFTLGMNQVEAAIRYVKNQKRHHANSKLWPEWEESDEPSPDQYSQQYKHP